MAEPIEFGLTFENGSYKIKNGRNVCLEFEFIEDEDDDDGTVLYISKIVKCGDGKYTAREMIKLIEDMAKSMPVPPWSRVKYIKLEDGSSINVCAGQNSSGMHIDLRYLKILTTGESWYNSFGYKSLKHDANVAHNAVIINKPMHLLLSELVDQQYFDQAYIKKFKARFPELSTDWTVKEYVTAMSKEVPRSGTRTCTKEQEKRARLLFNLVDYFVWVVRQDDDTNPNYLEYDVILQKKVKRGPTPRASPKGSPKASPKGSPKSPKSPKGSPKGSPKSPKSPKGSPKSPKSPKASPRTKSGGGAKRTLRKSRRNPRKTRKTNS
jgi:hypothetical protein